MCFNMGQSKIFSPVYRLNNDPSILKALTKAKFNTGTNEQKLFDWVGNIVESGENAGYQYFLLFQQCFPKASLFGSLIQQGCFVKN